MSEPAHSHTTPTTATTEITTTALPDWMRTIEDRLMPFQKRVREFLMTRPNAALWATMGAGKTLVTLSALSYLREPGHILVIAPRNIAIDVWPEEIFEWDIPLQVTSLNITHPGRLDKRGKPLAKQRNLTPIEFGEIVDSVALSPAGLYTVGIDRIADLIEHICYAGVARIRPPGQAHPDGDVDLDVIRDHHPAIVTAFTKRIKNAEPTTPLASLGRHVSTALAQTRIIKMTEPTAGGKAAAVVFAHKDPNKARILRDELVTDTLSEIITELCGQHFRVQVHINHPDYSRWPFPTVILDESQGFKNPSSGRFKAIKTVRPYINRVIELSGTPSPEGLDELWAQIYLLDQGQTLGHDYTEFLQRWFVPEQMLKLGNTARRATEVTKWKISDTNATALHAAIEHLAISAENTELKLPGYAPTIYHNVTMSPDLTAAYKKFAADSLISVLLTGMAELRQAAYTTKMIATGDVTAAAEAYRRELHAHGDKELAQHAYDQIINDTGDTTAAQEASDAITLDDATAHRIEADNSGVLRNRLLQFATGSVYVDIDPSHPDYAKATAITKNPVVALHDLKTTKVVEIVLDHFATGDGGSVLVVHRYDYQRQQILAALEAAGITGARVYNGMPDTRRAWNKGEIPVMLIHPASAGHGLNLQRGGHVLIWASLPDSNEHYQQTPARLNRMGQTHQVIVHAVVTEGTVDQKLPAVLASKQRTQNALLEATRNELRPQWAHAMAAVSETLAHDSRSITPSTDLIP